MAITRAQQVRQMLREGSKKPVTQAGVKNFLGKQEMVKAPKFWLSEPDHVKAKLAYITDEEEKILIDKNLYGSLRGRPNKGPAGLPSLQGGDFGAGGGNDKDKGPGGGGGPGGPGATGQASQKESKAAADRNRREAAIQEQRRQTVDVRREPTGSYDEAGLDVRKTGKDDVRKTGKDDDPYEGTTQAGGTEFVTNLVEGVNIPDKDTRDRLKTTLREKNPNPLLNFLDPRRRLYNTFPNNPINERKYVEYLESQGVDVPQSIKDAVARGKKLSYDEFQELREFEPEVSLEQQRNLFKNLEEGDDPFAKASAFPMDFASYMASQGNFGLLTGGDLGNLKDFKNPGTVINPLTGLPYTDFEFEKLKRESGQGASSYDRGPGEQGTGLPPPIMLPVDDEGDEDDDFQRFARLMADGGSVDDIEREAMFLGGITKGIKKAVKGIKKIAKSPIGKAALIAGGAGFFGMGPFAGLAKTKAGIGLSSLFGKGSFNPLKQLVSSEGFTGLGPSNLAMKLAEFGLVNPSTMGLTGMGKAAAIGIPSIIAGLTSKKEDKFKEPEYPPFDMQAYLDYPYDYQFTRAMANGGIMRAGYQEGSKEPVAKKTMPLLDMDGKEMDLREDGGFVPIGRMEKADDVPARLSKNEFVFTADAVRNAGDGDVDKGAEVMYNMMKNLESGGDVSEESQGLQGAREMFQTSKRLEEVL
jgi:hypothetical protein